MIDAWLVRFTERMALWARKRDTRRNYDEIWVQCFYPNGDPYLLCGRQKKP